ADRSSGSRAGRRSRRRSARGRPPRRRAGFPPHVQPLRAGPSRAPPPPRPAPPASRPPARSRPACRRPRAETFASAPAKPAPALLRLRRAYDAVGGEVVRPSNEGRADAVRVDGHAVALELADLLDGEAAGDDDAHVGEA